MKVNSRVDEKLVPGFDYTMELTVTFQVIRLQADGSATGLLDKLAGVIKGTIQGRALDIVIKEGKLTKSDGTPIKAPPDKLEAMQAPIKVNVTRTGMIEPQQTHPIFSFFAGQQGLIGPIFSNNPVAPGDSWVTTFQSAQAKAVSGPQLRVKYTFSDMRDVGGRKYARIVMDEKQKLPVYGAEMDLTIKSDALFDPERGECLRQTLLSDLSGSGEYQGHKMEMSGTTTIAFELLPTKK